MADKLSTWTWGFRTWWQHGRPEVALGFLGGVGDDLLCTVAVDAWLRRGARRIWFFTRHPELYPHYDARVRLIPEDPRFRALAARLGRPLRPLAYSTYEPEADREVPPPGHLLRTMCRLAGLSGRVPLQPTLPVSPTERAGAAAHAGVIALQTSNLTAGVPMKNKQWPADRFAAVAARLRADGHRLVQLGAPEDAALPDAQDLRGATTLRQAAALLAQARLFIGPVGFLMHLARAVECPAVIIYGGRESPAISGYPCNANLTETPPCSPCWQRNRCDHDRACLAQLPLERVTAAVDAMLSRPRGPLVAAEAEL